MSRANIGLGIFRFLLLIGQLKIRIIYFRIVYWLFPNKKPQSPCKRFRKKNSLACYKIISNQKRLAFDHYELFRIVNPKAGEYYVLPIEVLQKKAIWHISYHSSGDFHWRLENGERAIPRDGEADDRRSSLMNQAMWHISGQLDGYCLAVGSKVTKDTLRTMIEILDGYILPPLKDFINIQALLDKGHRTIPMIETPHRWVADKVVAEAMKKEDFPIRSFAEIKASIKETFGDQCKVVQLEPQNEKYTIPSLELMEKLIAIARDLSSEKMKDRPTAFWTESGGS